MTDDESPAHDDAHDADQDASPFLQDALQSHLDDVDAEHALLVAMWNTPGPSQDDAAGSGPGHLEVVPDTSPGHVTVVHQARALTAGDLRAALVGVPDEQPVAVDVPLDPGGLELHRQVLTAIGGVYLLMADEDEILDPSFVLRTDYPAGVYEVPDATPRPLAGDDHT